MNLSGEENSFQLRKRLVFETEERNIIILNKLIEIRQEQEREEREREEREREEREREREERERERELK